MNMMRNLLASNYRKSRLRTTINHYSVYERDYKRSLEKPDEFWGEAAESLAWKKKWDQVLTPNQGYNREWFKGAEIDISYNCLDRHVEEGRGEFTAIITDDPINRRSTKISYSNLLAQVERMAGFLARKCQHKKHDRVIIYMPMVPECLVAKLACARLGLIHCVVFGGFSPKQLALRIEHTRAKTIMTVNGDKRGDKMIDYSSRIEEAIIKSGNIIENCIVFNRPGHKEFREAKDNRVTTKFYDWVEESESNSPHDGVAMKATDPLYILHTSGTTGAPKGVVRSIGDYAVALNWSMKNIYACQSPIETGKPTQPWWAASDFGWVVGHSYITYAPLLTGVPTVIYQGKPVGTPDSSQYFRVLTEHQVTSCFVTPSSLKAIRREDDRLEQSIKYLNYLDSSLKHMFIAGEHCDRETFMWIRHALPSKISVNDHWWQTETGWALTAPCHGIYSNEEKLAVPIGSTGKAIPGVFITAVDEEKNDHVKASTGSPNPDFDEIKRILVKVPMPPGFAKTLWEEDDRFRELYFTKYPGYYDSMDAGHLDDYGNVFIISRSDDVINVSGHRLCTGSMEEACLAVKEVVECAVIATPHKLKGQEPMALVILKKERADSDLDSIRERVIQKVKEMIGPIATMSRVCIVPALPKTRSGKIARASLLNMACGKDIQIPVTIENSSVYLPIYEEMKIRGLEPTLPVNLPDS